VARATTPLVNNSAQPQRKLVRLVENRTQVQVEPVARATTPLVNNSAQPQRKLVRLEENRTQIPVKPVADAKAQIVRNDDVNGRRDVTIEHRRVFEISNTTSVNPSDLPQKLQFAIDKDTRILFLVDTGCEISLLPKALTNGVDQYFRQYSKAIQGIGDNELHPIGSVNVELKLGDLEPIRHNFWVTQEYRNYGIIGLDMLEANKLTIAPHKSELYDEASKRSVKLFTAASLPAPAVAMINKVEIKDCDRYDSLEKECLALLTKYPELTETPDYTRPPKHGHTLKITTQADYQPQMIRARKCNEICRRQIIENFEDLRRRGAVEKGRTTTYASPVTVVPKKDGKLRICVDYTTLNKVTIPLSYPLPRIDTLPEKIPDGTKFFSTIDLKEAYYSLPIESDSQKLAAIITTSGCYVPKRTTFGLRNAPTRFQQFMDDTFADCEEFTFIYLDDVLIFSSSESEHIAHLKKVLQALSKNGLYLNISKCSFAKLNITFLGHRIGVDGIDVLESKIEAVKNLPIPRTRRELKRFLGMINYYHRHIPKIAEVMAPLNEISGGSKASNRAKLELNDAQIKAYHDTIATLAEATTLAYERHDKPLILFSDASDTHVGASLEQEGDEGEMKPLAFFSKKLPPSKQSRSTFYKELRGVYLSLKHFQSRVLGRELIIRTDSKAVERAITNEVGDQSPYARRWICAIKEFNPVVKHIDGRDNVVADSLSRPPTAALYVRVQREDSDYAYTSESDASDSEIDSDSSDCEEPVISPETFDSEIDHVDLDEISCRIIDKKAIAMFQSMESGLIERARSLKKKISYTRPENMAYIVEDGIKRAILPKKLRLTVYNAAHNRLHLGKEKSIEAIARTFWWPELRADINKWVTYCITCQQTKVARHNRPNIGFFPNNIERFQFVHMDLIGPLDESIGFKYVMVIKDRATAFLVTAPLPDKCALTCRDAFMQNWVGHYGVPQVVLTDKGKEFLNKDLRAAFEQLSIQHRETTAGTPQTNGYVERQNRTINVAFRSLVDKSNWALHLPLITSNINNSFIEGSPYTPAQYALGCSLNLSGEVLFNQITPDTQITRPSPIETEVFLNCMADVSRKFRTYKNTESYYEPGLFECKYILLKTVNKRKMDKLYHGPYEVERELSTPQHMYIKKGGDVVKVSIRNVKAYAGPLNLEDTLEPKDKSKKYNLRKLKPVQYAESLSEEN